MAILWAKQALLAYGWAQDVRIDIGPDGRIKAVASGQSGPGCDVLLPAPANLHSHAFQRAMAGMTERRGPDPADSFWTWRQLMYRFLDRLTPDHIRVITAFVQMEMLEAGYTCTVEFHYLHHRPGGAPYDQLAEMAQQIAAAAELTGIGLTLLPVQYQFGGCDRRALGPGQIRFGTNPDQFARLHAASREALLGLPADTILGVAPHSLRAVAPGMLADLAGLGGPVHMHLAEQHAEVAEVRAAYGARPVEWLLDNADVDERWCLIHCTQMDPPETVALARTGAVAGLCPITESNLGDGIFDGMRWQAAGGRFGIGSDSNIRIGLTEELRLLEHTQRLRDGSRAAFATADKSTGRMLFEAAAQGSAQAAGRGRGVIAVGEWADLLALDGSHIDLDGRQGDDLLDAYIFAGNDRMVSDVWSAGRHLVTQGRHIRHDQIKAAYRAALRDLRGQM